MWPYLKDDWAPSIVKSDIDMAQTLILACFWDICIGIKDFFSDVLLANEIFQNRGQDIVVLCLHLNFLSDIQIFNLQPEVISYFLYSL